MSYYNKGPNFARNAIHKGSIDIACTQEWINANQLYNYVLSHETTYQFTVLRMEPIYIGKYQNWLLSCSESLRFFGLFGLFYVLSIYF